MPGTNQALATCLCQVHDYMHLTQTVNMLQLGPAYMTFIAGVAVYFAPYIAFA